jgi:hypothetical protein
MSEIFVEEVVPAIPDHLQLADVYEGLRLGVFSVDEVRTYLGMAVWTPPKTLFERIFA